MSFTFFMYTLSLGGIICMFVYFTQSTVSYCHTEKFIVSLQLFLSVGSSIIAIMPTVQERQPKSGLLQASGISLYTTYLSWSAFTYSDSDCNKLQRDIATLTKVKTDFNPQSIIGVVVAFVLVIFSSIRTSSQADKFGDREDLGEPCDQASNITDIDGEAKCQVAYDNEENTVAYSYTFFHVMMMLASLYIMMTITNWYKPSGVNFNQLSTSQASF